MRAALKTFWKAFFNGFCIHQYWVERPLLLPSNAFWRPCRFSIRRKRWWGGQRRISFLPSIPHTYFAWWKQYEDQNTETNKWALKASAFVQGGPLPLRKRDKRGLGPVSRKSRNFYLCIFKTKASRAKKLCSYFYFYSLYNIWKDQLYRISGLEFYELLSRYEKFSGLSRNGPWTGMTWERILFRPAKSQPSRELGNNAICFNGPFAVERSRGTKMELEGFSADLPVFMVRRPLPRLVPFYSCFCSNGIMCSSDVISLYTDVYRLMKQYESALRSYIRFLILLCTILKT